MKLKSLLACGIAVATLGLSSEDSSGAVTPYSWIRLGEGGSLFADSSGANHPFNAGFSTGFGGDPGAVILPTAVGGPLGNTAAISSLSARFGYYNRPNGGMWIQGPNNTQPTAAQWSLPQTNWVAEAWAMPVDGRQSGEIFNTGTGQFGAVPGGVAFRVRLDAESGEWKVRLNSVGPNAINNFQIGDEVTMPRTRFTHIAAVNDNGKVTFYVNGVQSGATATENLTGAGGTPYIGSGQDTGNPFWGFIDEVRYSTFAPGAFVTNDLLLLPAGPSIVGQPQSTTVWEGAPAIFKVATPVDDRTSFQWKVGGVNISGATSAELIIPSVVAADSGKVYTVVLSNSGVDKTSDAATLTVKAPETANNAFYRAAVNAEASLLAYFPVDGDTGSIITNAKDNTRNAAIMGVGDFDGRTNRAYGVKSFRLQQSGGASLSPNPAFEFADGTGTIEALIYLATGSAGPVAQNIFAVADSDAASVWQFQVSAEGNSLIYRSDVANNGVSWVVTPSLLGRLAHVALVFNGANVTAYVDGTSLGTKPNPGFGVSAGVSAWIGAAGETATGFNGAFNGNIDELAIYGDALSDNAIAIHNSRFLYGTAVTAPTITSAPSGTVNVLAGGAPQFRVVAAGTAPLSYQWKFNGQPIQNNPSATTAALTILNSTVASSGVYTVTVTNPQGSETSAGVTVNFAPAPVGDAYAAKVLSSGPSAYYRLNETSGTTLVDSAGGLNGTYGAGVVQGAAGAPGTAGTAATWPAGLTSTTTVPYTPVLNPAGAYTIEYWAKPELNGNTGGAIVSTQNRNTGRAGYVSYQGFNVNGWETHLGFQETVIFLQGTTPPAAARWDHIVATWDGVSDSRMYVNGVVEATSTQAPTRPNLAQPFEIGSRFNGQQRYRGVIDEIAFYNKALTAQDVTNHFSVAWVAAAITSNPGNATAVEQGTLVLTGSASGYPNKYQWFKDGVAIVAATNPDGSAHYGGITTTNLTITQITEADAGQYYLQVLNPLGDLQTTTATVTFAHDTVKPVVTFVGGDASLKRVRVAFSKPVAADTATTPGNYVFTGGLVGGSVVPTTDPAIVDVILNAPMTAGATYSLTVNNVKDTRLDGNVIAANSTTFKAYALKDGALAMDVYRGIPGGTVAALTADAQYPDGVHTNLTLTSFSFDNGSAWEQYGAHVYGWIKPTVAGDYKFYIRSDDASELWLSTDATSANSVLIAAETGCCNGFAEDTARTSAPITLAANTSYFIEAFLKEGGGGDYVHVAWRPPGDTTAVGSLQPIPGTFLSAYAPVPKAQLTATLTSGQVVITWTGAGRLQDSTNLTTWNDVQGNPASGYSFIPAAGAGMRFFRIIE